MTPLLKDESRISIAMNVIENFYKASGLCLNINKCELTAAKGTITSYYNILVKKNDILGHHYY